jgi:hypothetical protein
MDATSATQATELDAVRRRRAELREVMTALEQALDAPAEAAVVWGERVHTALLMMVNEFREHVVVTEGPGGLHQSILAGDLRLANGVAALAEEHLLIDDEIGQAVVLSEPPVTDDGVAELRERGTRLLERLVRHRQRGADLIYEAYAFDVGGGD